MFITLGVLYKYVWNLSFVDCFRGYEEINVTLLMDKMSHKIVDFENTGN